MQRIRSRVFASVYLATMLLGIAVFASARAGHHFIGDYRILAVGRQGDNVAVQLSMRVINNSGADIKSATISLTTSLPPNRPERLAWEKQQPQFTGLTLHFNEHKIVAPLEGTFTIPTNEYEQWQKGNGPHFVIVYPTGSGQMRREPVELAPMP